MAKEKTVADLQAELKSMSAELKKLTEAHDVIVKENSKEIDKLKKNNEDLIKKAEQAKAEAKKQREAKAEAVKDTWREKIKYSDHRWVRVFNVGLKEGVDFAFNFEGLQFRLISGEPVYLSEIVINHLKHCGHPKTKLKQGEAGTPIKVEGFHHNFNVVPCDPPVKEQAVG